MKYVLYTSVLNEDDYDVMVVPDIFKIARANNEIFKITGILLFDGLNFTQYIEGEASAIDQLLNNIIQDKRHKNFVIISNGELTERLYEDWCMGYVDTESQEVDIVNITNNPNFSLIEFKQLISSLDII